MKLTEINHIADVLNDHAAQLGDIVNKIPRGWRLGSATLVVSFLPPARGRDAGRDNELIVLRHAEPDAGLGHVALALATASDDVMADVELAHMIEQGQADRDTDQQEKTT